LLALNSRIVRCHSHLVILSLGLGVLGCGPSRVDFRSESEELAFLKSQANPSLDQFRRITELEANAETERVHREWLDRMMPKPSEMFSDPNKAVQSFLNDMFTIEVNGGSTLEYYQEFLRRYPDDKRAGEVRKRIESLGR
jgi:hypothetical protein